MNDEAATYFVTDSLDFNQSGLLINVIKDPKVAESQFHWFGRSFFRLRVSNVGSLISFISSSLSMERRAAFLSSFKSSIAWSVNLISNIHGQEKDKLVSGLPNDSGANPQAAPVCRVH